MAAVAAGGGGGGGAGGGGAGGGGAGYGVADISPVMQKTDSVFILQCIEEWIVQFGLIHMSPASTRLDKMRRGEELPPKEIMLLLTQTKHLVNWKLGVYKTLKDSDGETAAEEAIRNIDALLVGMRGTGAISRIAAARKVQRKLPWPPAAGGGAGGGTGLHPYSRSTLRF